MKTLYESILDVEDTMNQMDDSIVTAIYQSGLMPFMAAGKYDFKKNKLFSKSGHIFVTGENGSVQVKTHKNIDNTAQQGYVSWEEYDSRHAEFDCNLFVDSIAIKNGFKYDMINHTGKRLNIYSVISMLWDSNLLLPFLNKKIGKGVEVDISGLIDEKVAQNDIWKDASVVELTYSTVIGNAPDVLGFKNISIKKLCIYGVSELLHIKKFQGFEDILNPIINNLRTNRANTSIAKTPVERIKTFLTNNPQTTLYLSKGGPNMCKVELVNGELKPTYLKASNIVND